MCEKWWPKLSFKKVAAPCMGNFSTQRSVYTISWLRGNLEDLQTQVFPSRIPELTANFVLVQTRFHTFLPLNRRGKILPPLLATSLATRRGPPRRPSPRLKIEWLRISARRYSNPGRPWSLSPDFGTADWKFFGWSTSFQRRRLCSTNFQTRIRAEWPTFEHLRRQRKHRGAR